MSEMALHGVDSQSNQLIGELWDLLEIQTKERCFTSLRIRLLFGFTAAKHESFLNFQRIQSVEWTTASMTLECMGDLFERFAIVKTSSRSWILMLTRLHHLTTSFHVSAATVHFKRICSSVSISSSQTGHLTEWRSIPLESKLVLVGIL